ncbi:GtrA family protein [Mesobacillus subterraneus]|uniref:GtrA family protein n=1 Tax=Mesobacillus subterraneus TaxID=285983 RepID=A0A427TME3_9BACI|nr:GtrA family protein [Mesobacillus subterraneus]RSD25501.1 GtrA family protein [Mesobacillus subterraneus]
MSHLALKLGSYLRTTSHYARKIGTGLDHPFIRFLLVGMLNTLIGMGMMLLLSNGLHWPYSFATFTGNMIGAIFSFLLNRSFTFRSGISARKGIPRFAMVIILSYSVSFSLSWLLSGLLGEWPFVQSFISKDNLAILLGTGIYTTVNFWGQKNFVFNKMKHK